MKKLAPLFIVLGLCACQSQPRVQYQDPDSVETIDTNVGRTDVKLVVARMVKSMVNSSEVLTAADRLGRKPAIAVRQFENATNPPQYIDTKLITDKIQTKTLGTGKFIYTTEEKFLEEAADDIELQNESGYYDQNLAAQKGKWIPPNYVLRGRISSIEKRNEELRDVYYYFRLSLYSVEQQIIVWQDEKEISKKELLD